MTGGIGGVGLALLEEELSICRLPPDAELPPWVGAGEAVETGLLAVTRTPDETSIVCESRRIPVGSGGISFELSDGWTALRVRSRLDHSLVGVLAAIASPLARAEVPIFTISTFDTDYVLFPAARCEEAVEALEDAGHTFH